MSQSVEERALIGHNHRGHIIDACSWLEKHIEVFILDFFVGERGVRWDMMREILLDRFHFDGKIATMEVLVKKSAGSQFKKQYGKLFGELRYIKDQRNFFAHYVQIARLDTDDISLISLRDGTKTLNYTEKELRELFERILRCSNEVVELSKNVKEFLP
ncbi:hypothetical protein C8P68_10212 [Mucilaginibacter yixingensis]|uniref:Cthe-2314-like HEPN domain-containing protein n=1 Tax=Mucilaginibacter yixingensis TaxID=1295612 RepID=A0A2T5JBR3_9SPHI|nr:hypothetical protein [Mucilaginibacter yixingensis]PTQ99197.1 hypothetical protein C8P68_10212 [Mucilaginibacter yixingensis]